MRMAVVGHVEWVEFVEVEHVPSAGEIIHARGAWADPAGGGAVAAVQLARLAGGASLFTALGDDELARRSRTRLAELGVAVHAEPRDEPTRRAFTLLDADGERTITTLGRRFVPHGADLLPWAALGETDGVYLTAGDAAAARHARAARILVVTPRAASALDGVTADAVVFSAHDDVEREAAATLVPAPALSVATEGTAGGSWRAAGGESGRWEATHPPGPLIDQYGSGDCFAAGLTYALAAGRPLADALALAARCGAWCASGRGPYAGQLTRP
ncbi:MAG TPA: PfkB family carbohydrate kinase [Solirubrobacteraceae bacterium]|nr:PfkB family carbohydrate kinase [Solirubrobacteraceae bacterium]